jgi:hypothetical protein
MEQNVACGMEKDSPAGKTHDPPGAGISRENEDSPEKLCIVGQ